MGRKFGFSCSWNRAVGISAAKGRISRTIGVPVEFTKVLPGPLKHTFLVVLIALCGCRQAELPICVSSTELSAQYGYDKAAADAKYKGKALVVNGLVRSVGLYGKEVDLQGEFYSVRASGADFSALRKGQEVTLKCRGDGIPLPSMWRAGHAARSRYG
jgi:hypothetical protein